MRFAKNVLEKVKEMKAKPIYLMAALSVSLCTSSAFAFKEDTHKKISALAASASVLAQAGKLKDLGLLFAINDERQMFPYTPSTSPILDDQGNAVKPTILGIFMHGAFNEDVGKRAANHFFNPLNDGPLTIAGISLFNTTSPNWILEDKGEISGNVAGAQEFSYKDAREYFYLALTKPAKTDRDKNWGRTFQTLGQVIHHLQDMTQPQHVRNESHLDQGSMELLGIQWNPLYNPSLCEAWTLANPPAASVFSGYAPVYSDVDSTVFTTPRKFWTTSTGTGTGGKGIAEFTNRGFFSSHTLPNNLTGAAFPSPADSLAIKETVDIETVCAEAVANGRPECPNGISGEMTFFKTTVTDSLRPSQVENPRAMVWSVFDPDLKTKNQNEVYALNRFTLDAANEFLIPRAVAYSAGMINYFFRGKMEISLPDEGVYGIIDLNDPANNQKDTGGFKKIKLKVKNVTPRGSGIEPMGTSGKLVAVAKFHRNNCYTPTLSGEYGSLGIDWRSCRSNDDDIVVSEEVAVPSGINNDPQQLTFTFTVPIPINATDLFLQVVYRGPLGDEADAVVVATKDIAEPHYHNHFSNRDQVKYGSYWPFLDGTPQYTFEQWCTGGSTPAFPSLDACSQAVGYTFKAQYSPNSAPIPGYDPNNPVETGDPQDPLLARDVWHDMDKQIPINPAFVMPGPVGSVARVVTLSDVQPSNVVLWMDEHNDPWHSLANFKWDSGIVLSNINQKDEENDTLLPSTKYKEFRGIFIPEQFVPNTTIEDLPPLRLLPSQINF